MLGDDDLDDDIELGDLDGNFDEHETTAFIGGRDTNNDDTTNGVAFTFNPREAVKRLWPVIVVLVAYICLFATKAVLLFPFLRTLVTCDSVAKGINRDSNDWSGSPHCGDRVLVAEHATWYRGLAEGLEHFAQCLSLPVLGALVDTVGRRRVMLIGVAGLGVQFLCWAAAARAAGGTSAGGHAPLLFVGGVGRVHERVTLGLGAYVYTGFGGGYRTVDCIAYDDPTVCDDPDYPGRLEPAQSQEVALFIAEAALPVQVTVTKWLSVGVTLRMPWGRQTVTATQETTNGNENRRVITFKRSPYIIH